jgi:AcrR family transcriptional regulator
MGSEFQRARRPEHKEERRAQLLDTAAEFLTAGGPLHELGLNELARRAGMAKSNVYRYFESREALLLELLERAYADGFDRFQERAAKEAPLTLDRFAHHFAGALADEPLLGQLTSALPSVLEHNLSKEAIRTFKLGAIEFLRQVASACQELCPRLTLEQHLDVLSHTLVLITGLWPHAHPAPLVLELVREPELRSFAHDYAHDLERALRLYARGLLDEAQSARLTDACPT